MSPRVVTMTRTIAADEPQRAGAERQIVADIERWRAYAVPDETAPLEAEDLVRLLRDLFATLRLDASIASGVTVNTVHYYRRKDIIDPPDGRTVAARYEIRHLWQIAGARLAGHLGLVTLAEARDAIRGAGLPVLMSFVAARVADARARVAMRAADGSTPVAAARPLPGVVPASNSDGHAIPSTVIQLPADVLLVLPAAHPATRSSDAARELVRAIGGALRALHSR